MSVIVRLSVAPDIAILVLFPLAPLLAPEVLVEVVNGSLS
jgi:hypothetical protein